MKRQSGVTVWFTGLSGAGKSTIALTVERQLKERKFKVERLDGDIIRKSLTADLGYSREDRMINIQRSVFVARLLTRNDIITLCAFISPYRENREYARQEIQGSGGFVEVFVNAPLEICEKRDVKGLYLRARRGEISDFTGISSPYEPPLSCELELETHLLSIEESASAVIEYLEEKGFISPLIVNGNN